MSHKGDQEQHIAERNTHKHRHTFTATAGDNVSTHRPTFTATAGDNVSKHRHTFTATAGDDVSKQRETFRATAGDNVSSHRPTYTATASAEQRQGNCGRTTVITETSPMKSATTVEINIVIRVKSVILDTAASRDNEIPATTQGIT